MRALLWIAAVTSSTCVAVAQAATKPSPGERAYQKCFSCHALEPGKNDLDGPSLHGVVGRRIAAEQGFVYSPAMKRFARKHDRWTPELLDRLVADPEALIPGTSMTFTGMSGPEERSALVDYLRRIPVDKPAARQPPS